MTTFTKDYQVAVTAKQKASIERAAKAAVTYWVTVENRHITMTVTEEASGNGIAAIFHENIYIEGQNYYFPMGTIFIGKKGGIHHNGLNT